MITRKLYARQFDKWRRVAVLNEWYDEDNEAHFFVAAERVEGFIPQCKIYEYRTGYPLFTIKMPSEAQQVLLHHFNEHGRNLLFRLDERISRADIADQQWAEHLNYTETLNAIEQWLDQDDPDPEDIYATVEFHIPSLIAFPDNGTRRALKEITEKLLPPPAVITLFEYKLPMNLEHVKNVTGVRYGI